VNTVEGTGFRVQGAGNLANIQIELEENARIVGLGETTIDKRCPFHIAPMQQQLCHPEVLHVHLMVYSFGALRDGPA
jgi:hypothetical protein